MGYQVSRDDQLFIIGRITFKDGRPSKLIVTNVCEYMVKTGLDGRLVMPIEAVAVTMAEGWPTSLGRHAGLPLPR